MLLSSVLQFSCTRKKNNPKQDISIGDLRNVHFPDTALASVDGFYHDFFYEGSEALLDFVYLDTVEIGIRNANDFAMALRGYVVASFSGRKYVRYDFNVTDTTINKVNGLFISGYTIDINEQYKQLFCFLTVANNKCYAFYSLQQNTGPFNNTSKQFFGSIQFNRDDFNESHYRTAHLQLHKPIGKIWHFTPDFELVTPPPYDTYDEPAEPFKLRPGKRSH
ncbi:MAG: hypothetical protein JST86_15950 [Bacteroidetes bacterium]|nr:hypothetical protein [Bacteroidota bacterium]